MGNLTLNGATSGQITLAPTAVAGTNTITVPAATGTMLTSSGNQTITGTMVMSSPYTMRNKIINGAMVIDQRYAGASFTQTTSTTYSIDRWASIGTVASKFTVQQNAASVTPPAGFKNYLGVTSASAYSVSASDTFAILQTIEGFNVADLAWGTASAQTVTVSFWVRSSLTGTFGGSLTNDVGSRSYPFSYTISSANTWEQKSVTITGDTTGTWQTNNSVGISLRFGLGSGATYSGTANAWAAANYVQPTSTTSVVGTSGATFYITGVQLEIGTAATPFEYRNYQQEFAMCERYYQQQGTGLGGVCYSTSYVNGWSLFPVTMRSAPTVALLTTSPAVSVFGTGGITGSGIAINGGNTSSQPNGFYFQLQNYTGLSDNRGWNFTTVNVFSLSSEL